MFLLDVLLKLSGGVFICVEARSRLAAFGQTLNWSVQIERSTSAKPM